MQRGSVDKLNRLDVSRATLEDLKNAWLECTVNEAGTLETLESGYADGNVEVRRALLDSVHTLRKERLKVEAELALRERLGKS